MNPTRSAGTLALADAAPLELIGTTPGAYPVRRRGIRTVPLRGRRWRVTRESGVILGYIDAEESEGRFVWRSARLTSSARLDPLGSFAGPEDALDVLRFG